jgi:hypothetical protein
MQAPKVTCPQCGTPLKATVTFAMGHRVKCPACASHFTIGIVPTSGAAAGRARGPNWKALLFILVGTVVFVGGGAALVIFCFTDSDPADAQRATGDHGKKKGKANTSSEKKSGNDQPKKSVGPLHHGQQVEVDKTVERGLAYLKSVQSPDGTWTASNETLPSNTAGLTALVGLTLLECGVKKDDAAIQKVAKYLRGQEASNAKLTRTYEVALAILFLDRLDDPQDKNAIPKLALRLVAGQTLSGGWTYFCPVLADTDVPILTSLLQKSKGQLSANLTTSKLELKAVDTSKLRIEGDKAVPQQLAGLAAWRGDADVGLQPDSDNSNTQFAILALWAAKARGVPLDRTLALVTARFHKSQNGDGSWGYETSGDRKTTTGPGGIPGSMTCAGLLGLAVGQGLVNEARGKGDPARKHAARQDPAIQRGLDFLAKQLGDPHEPWENASGTPLVDMYFMWSAERVGVIFNLSKINGKDWYGWGAEKLVANQTIKDDKGYWQNGAYYAENPIVNTCFALLFLKRANLAKDLTAKLALEE